jgi:hypothetical protein
MSQDTDRNGAIPDWYAKISEATYPIGGELRHIENRLRLLQETEGVDGRVGGELSALLTTLQSAIGNLVLLDEAARRSLERTLRQVA